MIRIFSLKNDKARQFMEGRNELPAMPEQVANRGGKKLLWMHVASLGEFEQGRPIIEGLKSTHQEDVLVALTFFSPSGYEVRKDYEHADIVTYLPLDLPKNVSSFLDWLNPDVALFIKNDLWFNYLRDCLNRDVRVVVAASIFRKDQIYFQRAKSLYMPVLKSLDHFFVQDKSSAEVIASYGMQQVSVAGDTRVDRVLAITEELFEDEVFQAFRDKERQLIVFGSVWPSDIEIIERVIASFKDYQLIVAPHDTNDTIILERLSASAGCLRYSDPFFEGGDILFLDVIGILSKVYRYARYAYVGGAFQSGVHNTLEPAAYGIPVFVGDTEQIFKFSEIEKLVEDGGILPVDQKGFQIVKEMQEMDANEKQYSERADINKQYITDNSGATDMVVSYLKKQLL